MDGLPEQLVQVGERREVIGGEEVGPQDHQVVLGLLGPLLLDDHSALTEHLVVALVVLLGGLDHRQCLDLRLRRVVHPAVQIAVSMGDGRGCEQPSEHGQLLL